MQQPDIVKIIQRCDTWSKIQTQDGQYCVTVFFDKKNDANDFRVEMMMVASGQHGYEKPDAA